MYQMLQRCIFLLVWLWTDACFVSRCWIAVLAGRCPGVCRMFPLFLLHWGNVWKCYTSWYVGDSDVMSRCELAVVLLGCCAGVAMFGCWYDVSDLGSCVVRWWLMWCSDLIAQGSRFSSIPCISVRSLKRTTFISRKQQCSRRPSDLHRQTTNLRVSQLEHVTDLWSWVAFTSQLSSNSLWSLWKPNVQQTKKHKDHSWLGRFRG